MRWLIAVLLCLSLYPATGAAWGRKGHAAVAALAESRLTPQAQQEVHELLTGDLNRDGKPSGRTTLAAIASWPDEIRDIAPAKAFKGWHTRANPVCDAAVLGACIDGHCVDQLIIAYGAVLKDRSQSHRERNEALKWVVHLVGDLHQPLHSGVGIDGGAVRVTVEGVDLKAGATLHSLWDNEIGNLAVAAGPLRALPFEAGALPADAPTQWMREARDVARKSVYGPIAGFACGQRLAMPVQLDAVYVQQSAVVARAQMERAGARLAQLLNDLLVAAPD
jgi:hypothetical protein